MKQPSYCLSIVFKKGDPYVLSRREPPATELLTLADTIAKYLGVMVRPVEESEAALKVFQQRFRKWEWLGLPLLFLFATLAGLVWWSILQQVGEWNAARFPEAVYFLGPNRWALAIPALFLGIGSAAPLIDAIDRLVLRDRHQEYTRYQKLRYGMSTKGFSLPFFMSVGIPCLILIFLLLDWYMVFSRSEIKINRFLRVTEEKHSYGQIIEIKTAPRLIEANGSRVRTREYVVRFSDGAFWSTYKNPAELDDERKRQLLTFVSTQSGIPVSDVEMLQIVEVD